MKSKVMLGQRFSSIGGDNKLSEKIFFHVNKREIQQLFLNFSILQIDEVIRDSFQQRISSQILCIGETRKLEEDQT